MSGIQILISLVLAIALWRLYHRIFHIVYFDAIGAILREVVICFVIAVGIVMVISSKIDSAIHPESPPPDYLGTYYNLNTVGYEDDSIIVSITKSEDEKESIKISGYAEFNSIHHWYNFDATIPYPEEDTFVASSNSITLTITVNSKDHTLSIAQERDVSGPVGPSSSARPFNGIYVTSDVYQERDAEYQETAVNESLDTWISDYFGEYRILADVSGEPTLFDVSYYGELSISPNDDTTIHITGCIDGFFHAETDVIIEYPQENPFKVRDQSGTYVMYIDTEHSWVYIDGAGVSDGVYVRSDEWAEWRSVLEGDSDIGNSDQSLTDNESSNTTVDSTAWDETGDTQFLGTYQMISSDPYQTANFEIMYISEDGSIYISGIANYDMNVAEVYGPLRIIDSQHFYFEDVDTGSSMDLVYDPETRLLTIEEHGSFGGLNVTFSGSYAQTSGAITPW